MARADYRVKPTPTVGVSQKVTNKTESQLVRLVRKLDRTDIRVLTQANSELKALLKRENISITLEGRCSGRGNCLTIGNHNSNIQKKWRTPLKRFFLDKMGIDTMNIPIKLVRDWYNSSSQSQRDKVDTHLSVSFNTPGNVKHKVKRYLAQHPHDIDDDGQLIFSLVLLLQ